MKLIEEIQGDDVEGILSSESRGVLVDFWSPWCGPCRVLKPHLERLAQERQTHWRIISVNTIAHPGAAEAYSVTHLPTLAFFRGGREVHRFDGAALVSSIAAKLDELTQ